MGLGEKLHQIGIRKLVVSNFMTGSELLRMTKLRNVGRRERMKVILMNSMICLATRSSHDMEQTLFCSTKEKVTKELRHRSNSLSWFPPGCTRK